MKAIVTKFIPAANVRGSRISATDNDGNRVIISNPPDKSIWTGDNHAEAAKALCRKMGWTGTLIRGSNGNGSWVFVWANGEKTTIRKGGAK